MMKVLIAALLLVVAFVCAQNPPAPQWPSYYSASVEVFGWEYETGRFFRWFYDSQKNKDRFDGIRRFDGEEFFSERIYDHAAQKEWHVVFQGETVSCFTRTINGTVPHPNFSTFTFGGKVIVDGRPCYHWWHRNGFIHEQYFDRQDNREPRRFDWADDRRPGEAVTWTFHEFDVCPQDSSLYDVPDTIKPICTPRASRH